MKKKLLALSVAVFIIFGFPSFAGGTEEEVEVAAEPGDPQYGGTLTHIFLERYTNPGNPDPGEVMWPGALYTGLVLERFKMGAIDKYGPRGTNEYSFSSDKHVPVEWSMGTFTESWEWAPDASSLIFHIRPGVYWGAEGKEHIMKSREYTADDFVFNLTRLLKSSLGESLKSADFIKTPYAENVYAEDKYTVVIETKRFYPEWWWQIGGYYGQHIPPEVAEAGADDWDNVVGTGPFMVEYVPGSHMVYTPNKLYWRTTTINDKEYSLPFVDKIMWPFIAETPTATAALRTGKIDIDTFKSPEDMESLTKTTPELLYAPATGGNLRYIVLRTDHEPLNDVNVRRALMIGTDRKTLLDLILKQGELHNYPIAKGVPGHVPLEELPDSTRLFFDYNPELARQMLSDAGYPDGFKLEIAVEAGDSIYTEHAELLAGMWSKDLNVELEFRAYEAVLHSQIRYSGSGPGPKHLVLSHSNPSLPFATIGLNFLTGGNENTARYSNPVVDELYKRALSTVDESEQKDILEEIFVRVCDDVPYIPYGMESYFTFWWPWVKNYWGELGVSFVTAPLDMIWIDQKMKKEMGY